jgi:signal transduction histidine kinase
MGDASATLQRLSNRLGADVDGWLDSLQQHGARWRTSSDLLTARGSPGAGRRDAAHHELYTSALVAAARLDEAISAAAYRDRRRVEAAERAGSHTTLVLTALALLGVMAAAGLAASQRRYALEAGQRRLELERVMEQKARFTRGLSHDLKNPLGAADGHAQLLEAGVLGELDAAQLRSVARIRAAVKSVLALVDDMLDLAAAESGELRIVRAPADLAAVVAEVAEEHRPAAAAAGLTLEVRATLDGLDGDVVETDARRVRQIVGNLLSNAVKYTPRGGHVDVRACVWDDARGGAHGCAAVLVSDTGPGIPAGKREHIFGEFTRLHAASQPGVGLGLAISRRLARLLGGDLRVQDGEGPGATFVLTLPLAARRGERRSAVLPGASMAAGGAE